MMFGIFLCLFTVLISPLVADFFQDERIQPVLITLSLVFIIGSFSVVHESLLTKKLDFKKIAITEMSAEIFSGMAAIIMAFSGFGVWSLVWRMLLGNLIYTALFWVIYPWRPSLVFSFDRFGELFGFSSNVIGSRLINYGQSNVDNLIVGKLLGANALGYYSLAYRLVTFPLRRVSWVITRVTFPAFSIIQDDNEKLRKGYFKVVRYISIVTFPAISLLFIIAPEFVVVFLGEKWSPMILPLQILCVVGVVRSIVASSGDILLSKGRADIQFKWSSITLALLTMAILFGVNYGIIGVASTITVVLVLMYAIIQIITNRLIGMELKTYLRAIYPATISSLIMIFFIFLLKYLAYLIYNASQTLIIFISVILGTFVYMIILKLSWDDIDTDIKSIYRGIFNKDEA